MNMSVAEIRTGLLDIALAVRNIETAINAMVTANLSAQHAGHRFDFDVAVAPLKSAQKALSQKHSVLCKALEEYGEATYDKVYAQYLHIVKAAIQ